MSTASWWVAIALAAVYAPAGLMKLVVPKSRLVSNPRFGWAAAMSDPAVKAIGAAEVLDQQRPEPAQEADRLDRLR